MDANHVAGRIALELIGLLYRDASIDDFNARLASAEKLPNEDAGKPDALETIRMAMAIKHQLEQHQSSEQGLLAMIDSAKDLSSRLDLTSLLNAIVTRARTLLGSHLAWLTVYDAEAEEFRVLATDGAISIDTTKMTANRRHGIAGMVMSTRLPFYTTNYLLDNRFPHDPVLDNTFRNEGVAAMAGVPLLSDDNVIGLLFVADRYQRSHTALSIAILGTLATHAAVAINNAKAFEQAKIALEKADHARAELERHARDVQKAAEAHEQLTSLLARGASLGTLTQTVAQLLGGSVLVLDEAFQVISRATSPEYTGTSSDAYQPHSPPSTAVTQAIRESRQGGRSVIAYEENGEICRVAAVIGGSDLLGAVLLYRHAGLDEISVRTFERSASVMAIVLLSQERMEASKSRDVSRLLRSLVETEAEDRASLLERSRRLGLDLSQPFSLILVDTEQPKPETVARRLRAEGLFSNLVFDEIDGALAIVCPTTGAQDTVREFCAIARREFGGGFRGILSKPIYMTEAVKTIYGALRRGLSILHRIGIGGQVIDQNQMALYSVLFESHDRDSLKAFINACIGPVIAHDLRRGTQIADTLLKYLDNNQNAKSTASSLKIHVNTVRQRLANVDELLGHWSSPNRALEIHVALRLWSLSSLPSLPYLPGKDANGSSTQ
ncbi:helix-turn-helix domain-containing protein [Noviherbaspirillum sp. CPCC 100848]|uniref:Helix-turn-helix domain-containing protein n=1 Tax=Noviherbaspirillum album TaxID=3080276 RepID=A0ABU6JBE1_9BURK|nr:helix-turn-helix domain-containing protein [Noviherbaspirillum sp. CPCC 100848]MEC4720962.1 helix-turn-helix domain-containing protein [Noviherbaspirillum sp. CPCC 100848]